MILNLKKVLFKSHNRDPQTVLLSVHKDGSVTAADIKLNQNVEIVNPKQVICTLDKKKKFEMELEIKVGRGFCPGDENKKPDQAIGVIAIDSLFSPVTRVRYAVESARVGQRTDYDRLVFEVWTDGGIKPDDAVAYAAKILQDQLQIFINFTEEPQPSRRDESPTTPLNENLYRSVDELEFSVRSQNCLQNADIKYIGELVQKTEQEMLKTKNFGQKSLNEIKEILRGMGLELGMKLDHFPSREEIESRRRAREKETA
jgi:DNA-directed RNA polymerase subunit alpha